MCHPDYQINAAVLNYLGVQQLDNENYPCPEGHCAIGLIEKGKSCCASNKQAEWKTMIEIQQQSGGV